MHYFQEKQKVNWKIESIKIFLTMSILDQIKLTKMREVSKLNKNQLEYDRKNFVKSSKNKQRFEDL